MTKDMYTRRMLCSLIFASEGGGGVRIPIKMALLQKHGANLWTGMLLLWRGATDPLSPPGSYALMFMLLLRLWSYEVTLEIDLARELSLFASLSGSQGMEENARLPPLPSPLAFLFSPKNTVIYNLENRQGSIAARCQWCYQNCFINKRKKNLCDVYPSLRHHRQAEKRWRQKDGVTGLNRGPGVVLIAGESALLDLWCMSVSW